MEFHRLAGKRIGRRVASDVALGDVVVLLALRAVGLDPGNSNALGHLVGAGEAVQGDARINLGRGKGRAQRRIGSPDHVGAVALNIGDARRLPPPHSYADELASL